MEVMVARASDSWFSYILSQEAQNNENMLVINLPSLFYTVLGSSQGMVSPHLMSLFTLVNHNQEDNVPQASPKACLLNNPGVCEVDI